VLILNKNLNYKQKYQYAKIESISYYEEQYKKEIGTEQEGTIFICAIVIYCLLYFAYKHLINKWRQKKEQMKLKEEEKNRELEEERNKNEEEEKILN
jgi:amino acid permease